MAEETKSTTINVDYDKKGDILTFAFTEKPEHAIAEEAADEVWVRYNENTNHIVTIDILNFSIRLKNAYGPELIYQERDDLESLMGLVGLNLPLD